MSKPRLTFIAWLAFATLLFFATGALAIVTITAAIFNAGFVWVASLSGSTVALAWVLALAGERVAASWRRLRGGLRYE